MDKKTIYQRLESVENDVAKLNNTIFAMKTTDIAKYGTNYEKLSTDAAVRAERIACRLRNLIRATDFTGKSTYMKEVVNTLGIQVSYEDSILSITLHYQDYSPKGESETVRHFYMIRCTTH